MKRQPHTRQGSRTPRLYASLPPEQHAKLQRYAKANGISQSYAAQLMIAAGLQSWRESC